MKEPLIHLSPPSPLSRRANRSAVGEGVRPYSEAAARRIGGPNMLISRTG